MRKSLPIGSLPSFHWINNRSAALDTPLQYLLEGRRFTIPRGFVTDFATIPKIFWSLFGPTGAYTWAAILHDWLLKLVRSKPTLKDRVTAREADRYFRLACAEFAVNPAICWLLWTGVRLGALGSRERREGWWRDAPLVTLWAVLALPIVVPIALGVGLGMIPYGLYLLVGAGLRHRAHV